MNPATRALARRAVRSAVICAILVAASTGSGAGALDPQYENRPVKSVSIRFENFNPREKISVWRESVLGLIRIREGAPLTAGSLEDSKKALTLLNKFSSIRAEVTGDRGRPEVAFILKPYRFIRDIAIRGNYPVFEKDIYDAMTVEPGDPYDPGSLAAQEELIRKKLSELGYPVAGVSVTAVEARDGNFLVRVSIAQKKALSCCDVSFTGNSAVSGFIIKQKLMTKSERFIESEFKKNVTGLLSYYRGRGFPDAVVSYRTEADPSGRCIYVDLNIIEGLRYRVEFRGNTRYRDFTLRRQVTLFQTGNRGNIGVRKSVKNIAAFYHMRGYLNAVVKVETKDTGPSGAGTKTVTFILNEGARTLVSSLEITGNSFFSARELRSVISTRKTRPVIRDTLDPNILNNDLRIIEARYRREGFAAAAATASVRMNRAETGADVVITVSEGPMTIVRSVGFTGNRSIETDRLQKAIGVAPGVPYREAAVADAENILSALIAEAGHPYATVRSDRKISSDRTGADVTFIIDEGRKVTVGSVNFSGNMRTMSSYLRKQAGLTPGEDFTPKKMTEAAGSIGDIAALQSYGLKSYGLAEKKDRVDFIFDVREKKTKHLGIGAGYKSDRGLFADAAVEDSNFLGRYKSIWFRGGAGQTGYNGSAGFTEPRLIGSKASAGATFSAEKKKEFNKSYGTISFGPELSMTVQWLEGLATSFGATYTGRKMIGALSLSDIENIDMTDQYRFRDVIGIYALASYDRRDSVVRPRSGYSVAVSVEVSIDLSGKGNSLTRERTDNFIKYALDLKGFYTPVSRLTFAAQGKIGIIQAYTSRKKIFTDSLWYLGGMTSVRGFQENMLKYDRCGNSAGGRASLLLNLEARIDLGRNFELTAFLDAGRLDDTFYDFWLLRASAGAGLRYVTPIGPIGLMYGFKLDRREGEEIGMLHVSIGYSF
ncbi:MAG: outer membrane protein assembly factor BamA [Chrysiogenales bacterium]|nr:MAG: outer membrane protein assembly factor BamA [Chrysiogenales bacterium]